MASPAPTSPAGAHRGETARSASGAFLAFLALGGLVGCAASIAGGTAAENPDASVAAEAASDGGASSSTDDAASSERECPQELVSALKDVLSFSAELKQATIEQVVPAQVRLPVDLAQPTCALRAEANGRGELRAYYYDPEPIQGQFEGMSGVIDAAGYAQQTSEDGWATWQAGTPAGSLSLELDVPGDDEGNRAFVDDVLGTPMITFGYSYTTG